MKILLVAAAAAAISVTSSPSAAYHSCAGWGESCGKLIDVEPTTSQPLLDALETCTRSRCSVECSSYLSSYYACVSSGDPAATVTGSTADCDSCRAGIGAWSGIGCNAELVACSYDLTSCTSCDDWLENGGDGDNLCEQMPPAPNSIDESIAVSACACDPAKCGSATKCGSACVDNGIGWKYMDPSAANFKCGACLASTCATAYNACSIN